MKRWIGCIFLLCCVFLMLIAAQGEAGFKQNRTWETPADQEGTGMMPEEGSAEWMLEAPYARAYYHFLQERIADRAVMELEYRFALVFIDEDEIPELLLFRVDDNRCYTQTEIYTYAGNQVRELTGSLFPLESGETKREELYNSREYKAIGYADSISLKGTDLLPALAQAIEDLLWMRDSGPVLEQVAKLSDVLESYGDFLAENAHREDAFTLIYLDNDDVPELVIMDDGWHLAGAEIYTYKQKETVYVGKYGQFGWTSYLEKEGIIFNPFSQGGSASCGVHRIEGTEDTLLQVFDWDPDLPAGGWDEWDECSYIYKVDGTVVSEEQYDEAWQKWDSPDKRELGYDYCTPVEGADIPAALTERLQTLILTRYDTLREKVLVESGLEEDAILLMDYDDYDGDGIYEAFVFCGRSYDYYGDINYSGDFWFVGADQCIQLPERFGNGTGYRKIDGLMTLGAGQKYLYYYSDYVFTADISGIWTVKNGEPVEVNLPQTGQVVYRGKYNEFELWVDSYNHYYEPDDDLWTGHTWRPYFYHYDWQTGELFPDEGEPLSQKELEEICGFDLAGEVEAKGYEVTAIVRWQPSDIVTINYTIPPDEEAPLYEITYENIIWDCEAKNYWRSEEWGVTSWTNAGVGGSI